MMKILQLRFKNLNSLYGEWMVDFTDPAYTSNGIFALIGPTGAGKSTILDAICLALYGATPRLGKITKSGNEIMSRQTGECYAEVLFESQVGRFRCHWEQRRARKKPQGALQDQEHWLSDAETNQAIETKKSLVGALIEEKTGMDFDRFTRSILLAQGGFDTFLKANAEQKSTILEQLTGTGIYTNISKRVHEYQRNEREKLELLQSEISGIALLQPDQEQEIRQDIQAKQQQEIARIAIKAAADQALTWLTNIKALNLELTTLAAEETAQLNTAEIFKPERDKLEQARKAAALDGIYATLVALRKQQADEQVALNTNEQTRPAIETAVQTQADSLKTAEQATLQAKENLKIATPLIRDIRSRDQNLAELNKTITAETAACAKEATKIDRDKQTLTQEQKKQQEAEKKLKQIEAFLRTHASDEWLIGGLAGVEEQLTNLLTRQQEVIRKENEIKLADTTLAQTKKKCDASTKRCALQQQELADATARRQHGQEALCALLDDRLLREYRAEQQVLLRERAFINTIVELEEHRKRLEDGKPCPLCGSNEHPFALGNVPQLDAIDQKIKALDQVISQAEELETANLKLTEALTEANKKLQNNEAQEALAKQECLTAEQARNGLQQHLTALQDDFAKIKQAILLKLQPLGFTEIPENQPAQLLDTLKKRRAAWLDHVKAQTTSTKHLADLDSEAKRLNAIIITQHEALTEKQQHLQKLQDEFTAQWDERKSLYGEKKPDAEENRLNQAVNVAEINEKNARERQTTLQQQLTTIKTQIETLISRINQRQPELQNAEFNFAVATVNAGFTEENLFVAARLPQIEMEKLTAAAKALNDDWTNLKARQHDREARLNTERAKNLTDLSLDEQQEQCKNAEDALTELRDAIAASKHKINENALAKERIKEKQTGIEAQKKEWQRWEKLHALIGSENGKKYRNFAQGLTFAVMVSHANRQLTKMTDRYLLVRDKEEPLELNVIDQYQAGEIRSTRNLSGGESFIVSLALALGLSKMASRKVRVDSLFLDEGFGTLDEDTLEIALDTLAGLQQEGKLIGIISHVSALKERIWTRITVSPGSGGCSTLTGAGCKKITDNP